MRHLGCIKSFVSVEPECTCEYPRGGVKAGATARMAMAMAMANGHGEWRMANGAWRITRLHTVTHAVTCGAHLRARIVGAADHAQPDQQPRLALLLALGLGRPLENLQDHAAARGAAHTRRKRKIEGYGRCNGCNGCDGVTV